MDQHKRPVVKSPHPLRMWLRRILYTAPPLAVLVGAISIFYGGRIIESLALMHYRSRVTWVAERGTVIKNYLKSLDTELRVGSASTITQMAPESLRSLPPCTERRRSRSDLPGVEMIHWEPAADDAGGDPWKNLASHWGAGSTVSRSLLKLLHLNTVGEAICEPEIRIAVAGVDAQGKRRQDVLNVRLRVNFSQSLPVFQDAIAYTGHSLRPAGDPLFIDEATARGVIFHPPDIVLRNDLKYAIYTAMGNGVAVGDVDHDGWEDIYMVGSNPNTSRLFRNVAGYFEDITAQAGVANPQDFAMGAAMGDVDGDTDVDILVTHGFAPPTLCRNRGDATFIMEPFQPLTGSKEEGATTPTFADVDNDGDLDLYIAYYGPVSDAVPDTIFIGLNGVGDRLYINDGTGHFSEEARQRGLDESRWTFQGAFADIDEDGDVDLYQVNDFGRNTIYVNDGTGHFVDRTHDWPGSEAFGFGMSGCWGDYDADGDLDMYISGIASGIQWFAEHPDVMRFYLLNAKLRQYLPSVQRKRIMQDLTPYFSSANGILESFPAMRQRYFQGNILLRRERDRFFDVSHQTGTEYAQWSWGSGFVDFQNDGLCDIYATNGFITGQKTDDL